MKADCSFICGVLGHGQLLFVDSRLDCFHVDGPDVVEVNMSTIQKECVVVSLGGRDIGSTLSREDVGLL